MFEFLIVSRINSFSLQVLSCMKTPWHDSVFLHNFYESKHADLFGIQLVLNIGGHEPLCLFVCVCCFFGMNNEQASDKPIVEDSYFEKFYFEL